MAGECSLLVPDNGGKSEHLFRNSGDASVGVAIWGAPIPCEAAARRVVDDLHRPAKLGNNVLVRERGHIWVGIRVHGDVILIGLECEQELLPVLEDVLPDEKMGCMQIVLFQKGVQPI